MSAGGRPIGRAVDAGCVRHDRRTMDAPVAACARLETARRSTGIRRVAGGIIDGLRIIGPLPARLEIIDTPNS